MIKRTSALRLAIWGILFAGAALGSSSSLAQEAAPADAPPKSLRPADTEARLICATEKWAVWQTAKLDPTTAEFRAPQFEYAFYRQRLTEPEATLIGTAQGSGTRRKGAVLDDGTSVLADGMLTWYVEGKKPVREDYRGILVAVYPDGALYNPDRPSPDRASSSPLDFIPFRGQRLDVNARVEVAPKGDKEYGFFHLIYPVVRHKNQFALVAFHADDRRSQGRWGCSLQVFDLETKANRTYPYDLPLEPFYRVTAFDGTLATAESGNAYPRIDYDLTKKVARQFHRQEKPPTLFAIRNRIGYFLKDDFLYATDLTADEAPTLRRAAVREEVTVESEKGLIVWNGRAWETVPWLESWPKK